MKSMTAFGMGQIDLDETQYHCEIKTLNSRFVDVSVHLPRKLHSLEVAIVREVKKRIKRGKVVVSLNVHAKGRQESLPSLSVEGLQHYLDIIGQMEVKSSNCPALIAGKTSVSELLSLDGVLVANSSGGEDFLQKHRQSAMQAISIALDEVSSSRLAEGVHLRAALEDLLGGLEEATSKLVELAEQIQGTFHQQFRDKFAKLAAKLAAAGEVIPQASHSDRLITEIALATDKIDIEEELTRLGAHGQAFRQHLQRETEIGRKLEFLCQEMHREINTISNKLVHLDVITFTLSMKQSVEQIRQQIQNIE